MPTVPRIAHDIVLLIARVGLGIVLIAHGWQKLDDQGVSAVAGGFEKMGVPLPTISAYYATFVELLGGIALILGLVVPLVGALVVIDMAGAFLFVHSGNGVFVSAGGFELVLLIGFCALLLGAYGSGKFGVDQLLFGRRPATVDAAASPQR